MNAPSPNGWKNWITWVAGVFLLQIGAIWLLGQRGLPAPISRVFETSIKLAPALMEPNPSNPTVYALPAAEGFSGNAWLNYKPIPHQLARWNEPAVWLSLNESATDLAGRFSSFITAGDQRELSVAAMNEPALYEPAASPVPLAGQSLLQVEGNAQLDMGQTRIELPSWRHTELLTNTIVQVTLNPAGQPFSHRLSSSCGFPEADAFAMKLVRQLRFRTTNPGTAPNAALPTVRLIFRWHTISPTSSP